MELSFILIEDCELDCFIARKIIAHTDKSIVVKSFQNARLVFDDIINNPVNDPDVINIILLDLQMPIMDGFQFAEEFEKLPPETQKQYRIVVLSSTRNATDILRILTFNCINSLVEKPLTFEKLFSLILQLQPGAESSN